jgi:hypothetical protein
MNLEARDVKPIYSAPYCALPAGCKIIVNTLAELILDDVTEESKSQWASPVV